MANQEHTVTVDIMNRNGHETRVLIYDDCVEVVKKEMGTGKWARVHDSSGSNVYTQFERLRQEILDNQSRFTDTQKITLITALTGGRA
jgi:hypothetical protein